MKGLWLPVVLSFSLVSSLALAQQPQVVPLWSDQAPGAVGDENVDRPTLTLYPALEENAVGTAVVVCPGGGYAKLAVDHEGRQVAKWFNSFGVSAFILKYRLGMRYHYPSQMQDVFQAIRYVRENAGAWNINPNRIGFIGFSAGGHLASTAATHFDNPQARPPGSQETVSIRPDFAILVYPVISMVSDFTHQGSKRHLLGENPNSELAELHIFRRGGHGFGLAPLDAILSSWPALLRNWMAGNGWLQ